MELKKVEAELRSLLESVDLSEDNAEVARERILKKALDFINIAGLKERLAVLYEYEKHYLELIKEHKEEIKFAANLQEDLRKERAKFFAESLREVSETLRDAQVESEVASSWIKELVDSYTSSLDLSSSLANDHTSDTIGLLRSRAKSEVLDARGQVTMESSE